MGFVPPKPPAERRSQQCDICESIERVGPAMCPIARTKDGYDVHGHHQLCDDCAAVIGLTDIGTLTKCISEVTEGDEVLIALRSTPRTRNVVPKPSQGTPYIA